MNNGLTLYCLLEVQYCQVFYLQCGEDYKKNILYKDANNIKEIMHALFFFSSAFKETAFLLAVSSAALSHALAKACSSGRMERCTCDDSPGLEQREAWQWGVCGDNVKYSTKFLKKFLGQKRVSKDLRAQIDAHNINVGIRVSGSSIQPAFIL